VASVPWGGAGVEVEMEPEGGRAHSPGKGCSALREDLVAHVT
jgi:hypothetical protein